MTKTAKHNTHTLHFSGLNAPVDLTGADDLLPVIRQVMPLWPFAIRAANPAGSPFRVVTRTGETGYRSTDTATDVSTTHADAVDCVCDLVAEVAWEQIRSNPLWLCLHCAAVEFAGRLVLFPNRHRAGKSTLTSVLAHRGYRVFTDDFLPVEIDPAGRILGRANGVAPRLRLPVPDEFGDSLKAWIAANSGPHNKRYRYLDDVNLAPHGETAQIGAVVSLDRQDEQPNATLEPVSPNDIVDVLIRQNFARILHAGRILQASAATTETADLYQLSYRSAEDAADLLEERFASWPNAPCAMDDPGRLQRVNADLDRLDHDRLTVNTDLPYRQAAGATAEEVGGAIYLADPAGLSIQKLNPTSQAIWQMLEQPVTIDDISAVLQAAFPDIGSARIHGDTVAAFDMFAQHGLIETARQAVVAAP